MTSEQFLNELNSALKDIQLTQSFSGVRTVFGYNEDISLEKEVLAKVYGYCYALTNLPENDSILLLCRDPRPTGESLGKALVKGFLAGAKYQKKKIKIIDLGIITTPLSQTAVRSLEADGGVIVTASHNPIDYNGFKFLTGCNCISKNSAPPGALLSAEIMADIINCVSEIAKGDIKAAEIIESISDNDLNFSLNGQDNEHTRVKAERAYLDVIGADWNVTPHCLKPLTLGPALLDPNGGAGCGIGARVLEHFGVRTIEINAEQGYPQHVIDTDGIDPANGKHVLLRVAQAAARERAHFGLAFDYDADRGNLVLPGHDTDSIIPPQQVASFNIAMALSRQKLNPERTKPLAVVMSDATSLASEYIANLFGAEIFYVETGEINVVTKMHELRNAGCDVPVGVEGANGGTIFETSTCRDGLQAALSAALAESQPEISCEWLKLNNAICNNQENISLQELVASVPVYPNSFLKMTSPPLSHADIKERVEKVFKENIWNKINSLFDKYEFKNYEGTKETDIRTGDESGGWRLVLSSQERKAFVFLRGSKTEAGIWRMVIDATDDIAFSVVEPIAKEMFTQASK
ncbi:MAG: hypothetical protein SNJ70_05035 [Armatimonadota bacterium]